MARIAEQNLSSIFDIAHQWKIHSLLGGKSLIWPDKTIWTVANLDNFKTFFIDMPDTSSKNFAQKFQEQLAKADDDVTRLSLRSFAMFLLYSSSTR
jgi:5-methylcytosine-specific restriction enzyme B